MLNRMSLWNLPRSFSNFPVPEKLAWNRIKTVRKKGIEKLKEKNKLEEI